MKDEKFGNIGRCCADAGLSALISVGIAAGLIFLVGALVYMTDDPGGAVKWVSAIIAIAAFLSAGVIGAKKGGFLTGFLSGAILLVVFMILSLIFDSDGMVTPYSEMPYSLVSRVVEMIVSAAGAFFASKREGKRKKHMAPRVPKIKHK